MHRAARRARQRAEQAAESTVGRLSAESAGDLRKTKTDRRSRLRSAAPPSIRSQAPPPDTPSAGTFSGGTSHGTRLPGEDVSRVDDRLYSFSHAQGYEELPSALKLEELPREARTTIWNLLFSNLDESMKTSNMGYGPWVGGDWKHILRAAHVEFYILPLDDWHADFWPICKKLRKHLETQPLNKVFDLIQFILRHPECPRGLIVQTKRTFEACRLAYTIDMGPPPTILPAVTPEEGIAVVESLGALREAGLNGSAAHLRRASECITSGDWAGSIRESIHAVESVARQLDPKASKTLEPALKSLKGRARLHPALKDAFSNLYGYTSDQQGIRHALLDQTDAQVGQDEAVFLLGACASFASYLWRKHVGGESR